jgi:type IV secretory pathway VirB9-like protein
MSTVTLHTNVQRTRFFQHALAALSSMAYSAWNLPRRAVAPAAKLTAAESASIEAQKVRELAHSYSKTDPGFASDLYAAAARHEGLYED